VKRCDYVIALPRSTLFTSFWGILASSQVLIGEFQSICILKNKNGL
jgi:hypothetical protein